MASPNIPNVVDGIIDALEVLELQVRVEPDADWQPPEVLIRAPEVEQLTSSTNGAWLLTFELLLVVPSAWDQQAHADVHDLLADIKTELQRDQTLGAVTNGCFVRSMRPDPQISDRSGQLWFGHRIEVEVYT